MRIELRATAAHDLGGRGVRTDDSDSRSRCRGEREDAVVLQQHGALRTGETNERAHFRTVVGALRRNDRIGKGPDAIDQSQHPQRRLTHRLCRDPALAIGCQQLFPAIARRSGHFQIEPAVHGLDGRLGSKPIGHDKTVEAPFPLQDGVDDLRTFADIDPVQPVVGGHDRPGLGAFHRSLERRHVDFAQGTLIDIGTDCIPLIFRLVADEMLDRGRDAARLQSLDVGDRDLAGEVRILRIALEIAAVQGRAVNVDRRRQQDPGAFGPRLVRKRRSDLADKVRVPRRGQPDRDRKRGGCHPAHESAATARAIGTIADLDGRDAEPLYGNSRPEVLTRKERNLFLDRQGIDEVFNLRLGHRGAPKSGVARSNLPNMPSGT